MSQQDFWNKNNHFINTVGIQGTWSKGRTDWKAKIEKYAQKRVTSHARSQVYLKSVNAENDAFSKLNILRISQPIFDFDGILEWEEFPYK